MKYIIVGGGPTGLSLAYALCNGGHTVELIEKDKQLGGSWNSQWLEENYWSENSPRILIYKNNTKKLLKHLGLKRSELSYVYGNYIKVQLKILNSSLTSLKISDIPKILSKMISNRFKYNDNSTVQEWLDKSTLSPSAKKYIKISSIILCDRPDKTHIKDFLHTIFYFGLTTPYQFKNPNKWHDEIEEIVNNSNGSKIYKNTEVIELFEKNNNIRTVSTRNLETNETVILDADRVVLSCQSDGILSIINNSSNNVKNNWHNYDWMINWCQNTYYIGFGFQLHFYEEVNFPEQWCWSCQGDWNVIILPVSKWLNKFSNDKKIKTVWSCCIVDMDSQSKNINKTANECTKDEVIEECLRQINSEKVFKLPNYYKTTTSEGLERKDGKWYCKNTGFTRSKLGYLPMKGKIDNLYAIGCFTEGKRPSVAHMGTAINASVKFLNKYEPDIKSFHNKFNIVLTIIKLIVVLLVFYIVLKKTKKNNKFKGIFKNILKSKR